jgi:SAM-dependent methyltransferase
MSEPEDYVQVNLANWDERVPAHVASADYGVEQFVLDPAHLSDVVRFDQPRLGDLHGLRAVHLQCHIGTDTVSLARLGASVTGLDFSGPAVEQARHLAARTGADARFVQSEVYAALEVLEPGTFDLVYTGIGALCWLPEIARWAQVVAALLKPGGRLFVRDGHPMLGTLDETRSRLGVEYSYFERSEPLIFDEPGTYVSTDVQFQHTVTQSWNHGLGELVSAVLDQGLTLTQLVEHDSVPWNALPGHMHQGPGGEWRLDDRPWRLAATFTLQATKPA